MRYLPRVEDRPSTGGGASGFDADAGRSDAPSGRLRFPRSSSSAGESTRDALPGIGTVAPRRAFPKLYGSTSGESTGMGPSAARLARTPQGARAPASETGRRPGAEALASPARPQASGSAGARPGGSGGSIDTQELAARYRRAAARLDGEQASEPAGPAKGRTRPAPEDAGDPAAAPGSSKRIANARAAARAGEEGQDAKGAGATEKTPTLRERAYANPERTRNHLKGAAGQPPLGTGNGSGNGSGSGSGLHVGSGTHWNGNIGYGCWDDDWRGWVSWCHGGGHPWHGGYWSWRPNYWGFCWPYYGSSYWWWSSFWFPVFWYASYSPSTVVVYRDVETRYVEAPPVYEPAPAYGEGVIDLPADAGTRPVDESMERLTSPEALSAARAATQNLGQGDEAFRSGRYGDAVRFYAKAIEFQPEEGVLYLVLADALFATGDYHYGAYALRKALELDPSLLENPVDKHGFYGDPQDFDRQLAVLEIYLRDRPTDSDARLLLAANYLFGGRPAAAVDLLEQPASESVRGSATGALLLAAARGRQHGVPAQK